MRDDVEQTAISVGREFSVLSNGGSGSQNNSKSSKNTEKAVAAHFKPILSLLKSLRTLRLCEKLFF
jgi:hypothetical protein